MIAPAMGQMYAAPAAPKGISTASAASGPYAHDASASSPMAGTPSSTPIFLPGCSPLASGRPISSRSSIALIHAGQVEQAFSDAAPGMTAPGGTEFSCRVQDSQPLTPEAELCALTDAVALSFLDRANRPQHLIAGRDSLTRALRLMETG